MTLWWIGNFILLLAIVPVLLFILNRLLSATVEIGRYADDALEHGVLLIAHLDAVDDLVQTRDLVQQTKSGVLRYGGALREIL